MSSSAAPRCRHIKVNGTQCGSPALRHKNFCFYHQQNRPERVDCYYNPEEYPTGEITLPAFEDAHSVQTVIRQVVQMVLQKRLEQKTAGLLLYALQIASSNLKRMELEKPQPEQVVTDLEMKSESETPMATLCQTSETPASPQPRIDNSERNGNHESLPPGTIQACYQPGPFAFRRVARARPWPTAPKGDSDCEDLTVSLKRYPDTKHEDTKHEKPRSRERGI